MERMIARIVIIAGIGILAACGSLQEKPPIRSDTQPIVKPHAGYSIDALYSQYHAWQGVRYQRGGLSQRGIDCSGFVHVTFKSQFGVHLPRTTHMQSRVGREIRKEELRSGDLVFFRTGSSSSHVGIYLEKNKFLHASERKGVMISRLDHVYWKSNYWKSVRI